MSWKIVRYGVIAAIIIEVLFAIVWLYDTALRDPRFLDGWILFIAMAFQLLFSLRRRFPKLAVGQVTAWMQAHIYCGYVVIAIFAIHTQFSLPETGFEWALWLVFVVLVLSGVLGAFLTRAVPERLERKKEQIPFQQIPGLQAKIAREVDDLVIDSVGTNGAAALTGFYTETLHGFFRRPRNVLAHLRQSHRPLQIICDELESFDRYLDVKGKETLQALKDRVIAKNDLDFQYAHQGLLVAWLFVHIPATYCMIVLALVHVAIVHAFSSGV